MNTETKNESVASLAKETSYFPSMTIILPVEKTDNTDHLKVLIDKIEKEITDQYGVKAKPVIEKLHHSLSKINYNSGKKTVVICLSPVYEKMIYLDVPLDEKVMIDEPFEIRDLVNSMYPADRYILLVQSAGHFKMFIGDRYHLMKIKVNIPDHIAAYKNDIPEKIEYFSDVTDRKEIMLDKFIRYIDKELEDILNKYKLPVFIIGPERMNGHFKKYTHNEKSILDYLHGNYDEAKPHQLLHLIQPYLKELKDKENKEIKVKIEQALNANKFSFGIEEVWRNVMHKKGNLLLVEKNYSYPHTDGSEKNDFTKTIADMNPEFIKDAVDVIIEKVLESGGEVKFVDPDMVKDFQHIALFLYY